MKVIKFGGSCITDINLNKIAQVVDDNHLVVVVSAVGRSFANDIKVTDMLIELHNNINNADVWNAVCKKYCDIVSNHCIDIDISSVLDCYYNKIVTANNYHYTLSVGERLSSIVMAKYLSRRYIDADNYVIFDSNGKLDYSATISNISHLDRNKRYVVGGFYGADYNGNCVTFARGGGDITGALFSAGIGASVYLNYTDVCGVMLADPNKLNCRRTVRNISYSDMQILADGGARVLNNQSVYPASVNNITINVRSIYNMFDNGTMVGGSSPYNCLLGVTDNVINGEWITTVVYSWCNTVVDRFLHELATIVDNIVVKKYSNSIKIYSKLPIVEEIYKLAITVDKDAVNTVA